MPEEVVRCIGFRYIGDALTPEEGLGSLRQEEEGKQERLTDAEKSRAVPAYTTSAGWLGYREEKMKSLLQETLDAGYHNFKFKVGGDLEVNKKRLSIAREMIGYDKSNALMVDANQIWSVPTAITRMEKLAPFGPSLIEEPTSPDGVYSHKAIREALLPLDIKVATGEIQNRIIFKQLLQQRAIDISQNDTCRLGGVNEVLAVLLMAKKFSIPIVPHSGGVGLPEYT